MDCSAPFTDVRTEAQIASGMLSVTQLGKGGAGFNLSTRSSTHPSGPSLFPTSPLAPDHRKAIPRAPTLEPAGGSDVFQGLTSPLTKPKEALGSKGLC